MKNYILLQDRLSTGGAFILCDANAHGFPIRYASPGFADLFQYNPAECMGKSCGDLVAGASLLENDPEFKNFGRTHRLDYKQVPAGIAVLTREAIMAVDEMIAKPDEGFTFALVVNRKKSGEMIVNEFIMVAQSHPSFGWKYCVGLQNDVTKDISVTNLINTALQGKYQELKATREESIKQRMKLLQLDSSNVTQYLSEKTSEMWSIFMTQMMSELDPTRIVQLSSSHLPSTADDELIPINSSVESWSPLVGTWHGVVHKSLGGYEQVIEFSGDDNVVRVEVMGRTFLGEFYFDQVFEPNHLDLFFSPVNAAGTPPPPINYIAKIEDDLLHLCCPFLTTLRPIAFKGPGHCVMKRITTNKNQVL